MHWNDLKFCHLFTIISCKYTNSEYREIQPYHFVSTIRIIWCAWKLLKLSKTDVKKLGFGESELLSSHKLQVYNIIFFGHFANFNDSIIFLLVNFFRKFFIWIRTICVVCAIQTTLLFSCIRISPLWRILCHHFFTFGSPIMWIWMWISVRSLQ